MIQNLGGGWSVLLMTRQQHSRENKLLAWEGRVKNKANCELVNKLLAPCRATAPLVWAKREIKALKI